MISSLNCEILQGHHQKEALKRIITYDAEDLEAKQTADYIGTYWSCCIYWNLEPSELIKLQRNDSTEHDKFVFPVLWHDIFKRVKDAEYR